jgi:hypothetical protein
MCSLFRRLFRSRIRPALAESVCESPLVVDGLWSTLHAHVMLILMDPLESMRSYVSVIRPWLTTGCIFTCRPHPPYSELIDAHRPLKLDGHSQLNHPVLGSI